MLIDELKFYAEAGRGGDGVVRWRHEKYIDRGGPNGGDGGKGGDVYAVAVQNISLLSRYKHKKEFKSEDGKDGEGMSRKGKDGKDLIIEFPIGSIITNIESGASVSLDKEGQKELLLAGGAGGFGNEKFKSSVNTAPKTATPGKDGEKGNFKVELEIFADIGLIGLPNAGKSSLLNSITNANAKVDSYQFTTLDPNLGDFYGYTIADIPGLIEGASEGKGLGIKFLKHIRRTRMLAHLISLEPVAESFSVANQNLLIKNYQTIRGELEKFDPTLLEKKEVIVLTKTDLIEDKEKIEKIKDKFKKLNKSIFLLTLYDDDLIKELRDGLVKLLRE